MYLAAGNTLADAGAILAAGRASFIYRFVLYLVNFPGFHNIAKIHLVYFFWHFAEKRPKFKSNYLAGNVVNPVSVIAVGYDGPEFGSILVPCCKALKDAFTTAAR